MEQSSILTAVYQTANPTSPFSSLVLDLCPSGHALAARDTANVSHIDRMRTVIAEHHYFQQTNAALAQQMQAWSNNELHREVALLKEEGKKMKKRAEDAELLSGFCASYLPSLSYYPPLLHDDSSK